MKFKVYCVSGSLEVPADMDVYDLQMAISKAVAELGAELDLEGIDLVDEYED